MNEKSNILKLISDDLPKIGVELDGVVHEFSVALQDIPDYMRRLDEAKASANPKLANFQVTMDLISKGFSPEFMARFNKFTFPVQKKIIDHIMGALFKSAVEGEEAPESGKAQAPSAQQ